MKTRDKVNQSKNDLNQFSTSKINLKGIEGDTISLAGISRDAAKTTSSDD